MDQSLNTAQDQAGRTCPLDYRYRPQDIAAAPTLSTLQGLDALWVVGGLYGNREALDAVLVAYRADPSPRKALVFNGDFHWFDAEPDWFADIQAEVERHVATRGNVETELAREAIGAAGCGCGYPNDVSDDTVAYSNRIIERLHSVVPADARRRLAALPRFLRAEVGGVGVAIVHGDAHSLAGWGFSRDALQHEAARQEAGLACDAAGVRIFASSHTCMPVVSDLGAGRWVINNGAAGLPNETGALHGLCTRIATTAPTGATQCQHDEALYLSLQTVDYAVIRWWQRFEHCWPPGSDAFNSYAARIRSGPDPQVR